MGIQRYFIICLFFSAAVASKDEQTSIQAQNKTLPRLIGCYSLELITFRCKWDVGPFWNLADPADLRLFYMLKESKNDGKWQECPSYSTTKENECYFDANHTIIWSHYFIQLRSKTNDVYDEMFFTVEEIVFPDPPEKLNWTLLSLGPTGLFCDVMVSWDTPSSAADSVKMGWMTLWYETQYKETGSEQWKTLKSGKDMQANIYGLHTNTEYEVRVKSIMRGYNSGDFGDPAFILVSVKGSRVTTTAVFILVATAIGIMLVLLVMSRKQKLMVILLPPVPGPKIKGIDPVFLEKGQLTDFTSVLGAHPDLRPELYSNDPWVEFIQVDIDEPIEMMKGLDTPLLFSESHVSDSPLTSIVFQDDDSGRASCCDPDLSDHDHHDTQHPTNSTQEGFHPSANMQTVVPPAKEPAWQNSIYSQVAEVMPCGETMLCPEQNVANDYSIQEKSTIECKEKNPGFMMTLNERGYSVGEPSSFTANPGSEYNNTPPPFQNTSAKPEMTSNASAFPILTMPTPPEYTMVDGVGWKDSLLLKTSSTKITELKGKNNILEIKQDEANRLLKLSQITEKHLIEEKDGLLGSMKCLQHNLEQQCNLRGENERLRKVICDLKKQNEEQVEESRACVQKLQNEIRALQEQHQRELEDCAADTKSKLDSKDAEIKAVLDREEQALEGMRRKMKDQEKEKQSELIKLQMEFSAKLARAQSVSVKSQMQPQTSGIISQNIFKRKLQFLQDEKNKEIEALRQRVKELEQQSLRTFTEPRLKRRKI
ncbi:Growth hormone receptor [Bagarius yarrelli]|uniref:Growth hormone receptor n=1 Tax=Bagarius yarrelli TaxID=175774 RepID=A0A556V6N7_BAGYA|nr:Growth hormone receptor [Bagarius yarrelli]